MTVIGRTGRWVIALTMVALVSCREAPTAWMPPYLPYVEGDPAARRLEWEAHEMENYDYRVTYRTEWIELSEVRVEVRGGVVVRLVEVEGGAVITAPSHACWMTMDELFDRVVEAMQTPENVRLLSYDSALDYVRHLIIDQPGLEDDGLRFTTRSLVRR